MLLAGVLFYEVKRPDPRIASALGGAGQIIAFSAVGAPLSYLAASAGLPLQDTVFDSADSALGLDWRALLVWMNGFADLHPVFSLAYRTFPIQAAILVAWLAFSGRLVRLRVFMLSFFFVALATIAVSAIVPAEGVWGYYSLHASDHPAIRPVTRDLHLAIFHGLRDGSYRQLTGFGSEGIITFPSMHAAVALILALAAWPIPVLRWVFAAINVLMVIATPVDGGHYFIDIAVGLVIAALGWIAAAALVERMLAAPRELAAICSPEKSQLVRGE
ncbi:MAG: phosphatase PAP2 family protein [Bradyrhizobiaceae bacterium]|nr:phosphatase PAP2 family protein [Bradyrhizobiaceae bacterium]